MKFIENENLSKVKELYPFAYKILKVCGGYMVFENSTEYQTWTNQK